MVMTRACSTEDMTEQQAANQGAGIVSKQPLRVSGDISIQDLFLPDEFQAQHLWSIQNRRDLLKLC
jgi:hypothetical protein